MTDGMLRIVMVGSGRIGLRTARMLEARGHDVLMIERNPERCARIADEYVATVIEGDAARPSVLRQADLPQRDRVVAATNTTATNLAVCLTAKRLAPEVRTVMRTVDDAGEAEYAEFVDAVVFPEEAGARAMTNAVEGGVQSVETLTGGIELLDLTVTEAAPVAGRTLDDVALPRGSLVVAEAGGDRIAGSGTALEAGRSYLVAAEAGVADEVVNLFRG